MPTAVEITAASRLHFGMFSFGDPQVRQFGGVGAMIDTPALTVRITAAERFSIRGPAGDRVRQVAERISQAWGIRDDLPCQIEVVSYLRPHTGLGTGTQLALAVAEGLYAFFVRPYEDIAELARLAGRGLRSAIGLYGFRLGGLLVEAGKWHEEEISPLVTRVKLPTPWRFVLITPSEQTGLHGAPERQAFERLPAVPSNVTAALCQEALLHLLPAARTSSFDEFSSSLYRFGYQAGLCFAAVQGGAFATAEADQLVQALRRRGIEGVGQSSWGPTLFALVPDAAAATDLVAWLEHQGPAATWECRIAAPNNRGADISPEPA